MSTMAGSYPETPGADELLNNPVGINPLPAADGAVNPIKLAPGEPIPKDLTAANTNSHVKLDEDSYNHPDTLPGGGAPASLDTLPPVGGTMIPESSLPMGEVSPFINSAGHNSTTAQLAAQVPLEKDKVPEVVKESQEKAGVDPEASASAAEVKEKTQLEEELLEKVPTAPSTAEGTAGKGTDKAEGDKTFLEAAAATAAGIGAAAVATAIATKDSVVASTTPVVNDAVDKATPVAQDAAAKLPDSVKAQLPTSVQDSIATSTKEATIQEVSPEVPSEVKDSIVEAGKSPEAAASTTAVEDKKAVEAELLKEVKPVTPIDESSTTKELPKPVEAVKTAVLGESSKTEETPKASEQIAPAAVAKELPIAPDALTTTEIPSTAAATNGGATSAAETAPPATPAKDTVSPLTDNGTPGSSKSATASEQKKKNRVSGFFGKLKSKIGHKEAK